MSAMLMASMMAAGSAPPKGFDRPAAASPPLPPEARNRSRREPPVETNPEGRAARRRRARAERKP
jgi:hypothetical protein